MSRCPYCHTDVDARAPVATCRRCEADLHPGCALELTRCAACGGEAFSPFGAGDVDGWRLLEAGVGEAPRAAWVEVVPRALPDGDAASEPLSLRLDLLRRELRAGSLLAGEATLTVPCATRLGPLALELREDYTAAGWLGLRSHSRVLRRVSLLAGGVRRRGWLGRLTPTLGLYAPGVYRIRFRLPTEDLLPTLDAVGSDSRRHTVTLRLVRARDVLLAGLEMRVFPPGVDSGHVPDPPGLESSPRLSAGGRREPRRVPRAADGVRPVLG